MTFEMICRSTGYLSIGTSLEGYMEDGDMVVVYMMGGQTIIQVSNMQKLIQL